ncbi:unnamed protein product [Protopolystoma xenopodis]|uniref:SRCR domain-containing protein n=1 Tax=Protopolystoma xenopodis TaxID=117903 RepID=A0A448XDR2_9PLAT|nr:unnamed protein product [Protopolystoma xenopodis]
MKQRQHESSSKANRQLIKRNRQSSSGGTDLRISSPNTFTRNGNELNTYKKMTRGAARYLFSWFDKKIIFTRQEEADHSNHLSPAPVSDILSTKEPTLLAKVSTTTGFRLPKNIRLVDGSEVRFGLLQIWTAGRWRWVCSYGQE